MVGALKRQPLKEKHFVHGAFFVKRPGYSDRFLRILEVLVSHNGIYTPEKIEIGSDKGELTEIFDAGSLKRYSLHWEKAGPFAACILRRLSPSRVEIYLNKVPLPFEPIGVNVERSYFEDSARLHSFMDVMRDLYSVSQPSYGLVETQEMVKRYDDKGGKVTMGIDLERALPDIYWANFFGPDYVRLFGKEKLESAPCYRVEWLSDGGVLLLVTPTLSDYDSDPENFGRVRTAVKEHLGIGAFDNGDWHFRGRVPMFFSPEERKKILSTGAGAGVGVTTPCDSLSTVRRAEWQMDGG